MACPSNSSLTDEDLNSAFGDAKVIGLLPPSANGSSDREGNGMLKDTIVTGIVTSLKKRSIIPVANPEGADSYSERLGVLLKNIQAEYCWYESRYQYALQKLFNAIRMGYLANTEDTAGVIKKYLNFTQTLNRRLNDLTQVINGVSMQLLDSTTQMEKEIQQFNTKIQSQRTQLQKQNEIITSNEASTKIKQEMVKYTEEKARNSENLLKLYSFLNIVTVGLLVYVYKAAGDS